MERCHSSAESEDESCCCISGSLCKQEDPLHVCRKSSKREKLEVAKEDFTEMKFSTERAVVVPKGEGISNSHDKKICDKDGAVVTIDSGSCCAISAGDKAVEPVSAPVQVLVQNKVVRTSNSVPNHVENSELTESETERESFQMNCLPQVAFLKILSYLTMRERVTASLVSRHWYNSCFDPSLWRKLHLQGKILVTNDVFCQLTGLSSCLVVLDLSECSSITEQGLVQGLGQCLQLQELRVVRCANITDACLEQVGRTCKELKLLDISLCTKLRDTGIQKMSLGCTKLEQLTMDQCRPLTSDSLCYVAHNCPKLSLISIEYDNQIKDDGVLALVQNCQLLQRIHLNSCGMTFRSVQYIASYCRNVTILDVRCCKGLTDAVMLELVTCCKSVEIINLSLCFDVTDESVSHIVKHCTHLRSLYLVHCKITDEGLKKFCKCNCDLERLDVSWCQEITGDGVKAIVQDCPTLMHLGLVRCDKVEEELVTELSQQYPHIFLSTFMTEMNRMFHKAGFPNGVQAILTSSSE